MNNTLANLHDHAVKIYQNYNVLHPEEVPPYPSFDKTKPVRSTTLRVNDEYNLVIGAYSSGGPPSSIYYELQNNNNYQRPLFVDQNCNDNKIGKISLYRGSRRKDPLNKEETIEIIEKFGLHKIILNESEKLQKVLNSDFTQDFPVRTGFTASNKTQIFIAKDNESTTIAIEFAGRDSDYHIRKSAKEGTYDWVKLRETLNIFNNDRNWGEFPFYSSGSSDKVKEEAKQFFEKINSIPLDILHKKVADYLSVFKSDMEEINNFVQNLDNKTKPKFK